jgi:hypothetical protein
MKTALLVVSILGFAAFAVGQTSQTTPGQGRVVSRFNSSAIVGNVFQMRGNVRLEYNGTVVTADEADLPLDARGLPSNPLASYTVRGNVRVEVTAPVILLPW